MSFLFPSCPICGGATKSAEPDGLDRSNMRMGMWLRSEAALHRHHPALKAAQLAISVGRQIYKRVPGGGAKRCTKCGHRFN